MIRLLLNLSILITFLATIQASPISNLQDSIPTQTKGTKSIAKRWLWFGAEDKVSDDSSSQVTVPGMLVCVSGTGLKNWGCFACPTGHYSRGGKLAMCFPCQLGSYSRLTGAGECTSCPAGQTTSTSGSSDPADCYIE